jgi:phosphoribosylcarboxyaminoimidazole (NCAIR) mutase
MESDLGFSVEVIMGSEVDVRHQQIINEIGSRNLIDVGVTVEGAHSANDGEQDDARQNRAPS